MKNVFYIVVFAIFVISCNKMKTSKYTGKYYGKTKISSWSLNQVENINQTIIDSIIVVLEGDYLQVKQQKIHLDSLDENHFYEEGFHDYFSIKFVNDSIYYRKSDGGLGGGYSVSFSGIK